MEQADGSVVYAQYEDFYIESEDENYRLHVDGYVGTAGTKQDIPLSWGPFIDSYRDMDR